LLLCGKFTTFAVGMLPSYRAATEEIKTLKAMTAKIVSTLITLLIGYILIDNVPGWLNLKGIFATIVKIVGILVVLSALLVWI